MIKILLSIVLNFTFLFTSLLADKIDDIVLLFQTGDSKSLIQHFDRSIEIGINGEQQLYSNTNAKAVIEKFFDENEAERFEVIHKSQISEEANNCIGKYYSKNGKTYRVSFYIESTRGKYLIKELTFKAIDNE